MDDRLHVWRGRLYIGGFSLINERRGRRITDLDFLFFGMIFMLAILFMILDLSRPNILAAIISSMLWFALGLTYIVHGPTLPGLGWIFIALGLVELVMAIRDSFGVWRAWRYGLREDEY